MAQELNPVLHVNSPNVNPASITKASVGNRKAAGAARLNGITKKVNSIGSR